MTDRKLLSMHPAQQPCLLVHLIHGVAISAGILAHAVEPAECICSSKSCAVRMRMSLETGIRVGEKRAS